MKFASPTLEIAYAYRCSHSERQKHFLAPFIWKDIINLLNISFMKGVNASHPKASPMKFIFQQDNASAHRTCQTEVDKIFKKHLLHTSSGCCISNLTKIRLMCWRVIQKNKKDDFFEVQCGNAQTLADHSRLRRRERQLQFYPRILLQMIVEYRVH